MIQLFITMTGKGYGRKDTWRTFDSQTKNFQNVKAARDWIKDTYGKAKRTPMYIDLNDGGIKKIGYVIGFRNCDISHVPVDKWIQQDWIEFREVRTISP